MSNSNNNGDSVVTMKVDPDACLMMSNEAADVVFDVVYGVNKVAEFKRRSDIGGMVYTEMMRSVLNRIAAQYIVFIVNKNHVHLVQALKEFDQLVEDGKEYVQ